MNPFDHNEEQRLANLVLAADTHGAFDLWELGEEARETGNAPAAIQFFRGAVEIARIQGLESNLQVKFWISLGRSLSDQNEHEEAERWLRQAVAVADPEEVSALTRMSATRALAALLSVTGRVAEAADFTERTRALLTRPRADTMEGGPNPETPDDSVCANPRGDGRVREWEELLNRVQSRPPLSLLTPDEAVCLAVLVTATRPVAVSEMEREVQQRNVGWSPIKLVRVANTAVARGWLVSADCPASGLHHGGIPLRRDAAGSSGTPETEYRLADRPEELAARLARSLFQAGPIPPDSKTRLLQVCDVLNLPHDLRGQVAEWLESH